MPLIIWQCSFYAQHQFQTANHFCLWNMSFLFRGSRIRNPSSDSNSLIAFRNFDDCIFTILGKLLMVLIITWIYLGGWAFKSDMIQFCSLQSLRVAAYYIKIYKTKKGLSLVPAISFFAFWYLWYEKESGDSTSCVSWSFSIQSISNKCLVENNTVMIWCYFIHPRIILYPNIKDRVFFFFFYK